MPEKHELGRRAQARLGDLSIGIVATSPDPADPAARMNIIDHGAGTGGTYVVRVGDEVHVGDHVLVFTDVVPGSDDGHVAFTVDTIPGTSDPETEE